MSTNPRLEPPDPDAPADLRSVLAHAPDLLATFWTLYGRMWQSPVVDQATKEVARLRNARVVDCGFCRQVRFDGAVAAGLDEGACSLVVDGWEETDLPDRHRAALAVTDAFTGRRPLDEGARALVLDELGAEGVVELGVALMLFRAFASVLIALGLEPEKMATTVLPTPGS